MKNIRVFYLKIFSFLEVKFSIYLKRGVFVMTYKMSFEISMQNAVGGVCIPPMHSNSIIFSKMKFHTTF